jgi:hypothetical protein
MDVHVGFPFLGLVRSAGFYPRARGQTSAAEARRWGLGFPKREIRPVPAVGHFARAMPPIRLDERARDDEDDVSSK